MLNVTDHAHEPRHAWPGDTRRLRPAFIVIGAHKCGTTSLFKYLGEHRRVRKPVTKEIHFFDRHYAEGGAWYEAQFPRPGLLGRAAFITGEATPAYLYHPLAPARMRAMLPEVKLIAILREPAARAMSHWRVARRKGWDDAPTLSEALDREAERMAAHEARLAADPFYVDDGYFRHAYLARGRYAEQLERWLSHFPREQLLVLRSEDMFARPRQTWERACAFVGLDADDPPAFDVHNEGSGTTGEIDDVVVRMREYFAPHNQRLKSLLGDDFGWNS